MMNFLTSPTAFLGGSLPTVIDEGTFEQDVRAGNVTNIEWQQTEITAEYKDGTRKTTHFVPPESSGAVSLKEAIRESKSPVKLTYMDPPATATILSVLSVIAFPLML